METQIYRYQRLSPLVSNSTHINQDLCFTDVSEHMCALLSAYARLQMRRVHPCMPFWKCECVLVTPVGENIWQHSLHFLTRAGTVKASGRLKDV